MKICVIKDPINCFLPNYCSILVLIAKSGSGQISHNQQLHDEKLFKSLDSDQEVMRF